ncbi:MAG: hypothetical protein LBR69_03555 [Endomicrobium sp.]|jgi:hypothetical protein|nr:hypothetical protein [Endomicrobium sp.]
MKKLFFTAFLTAALCVGGAYAQTANPNISVIGNLISAYANGEHNENANKIAFGLSELEFSIDANLNPYSKAFVTLGLHGEGAGGHGHEEGHEAHGGGIEIEEAYVSIYRNLPIDRLTVNLGKYFVNFGRLNKVHAHAYPFINTPRVINEFIPAEDGNYADTGAEVSYLFPLLFEGAAVVSGNILTGQPFHEDNDSLTDYAYSARLNNSFMLSDTMPFEIGFSWLQGKNSVEYGKTKNVAGADFKIKKTFSDSFNIVLQGEYFYNTGSYVDIIDDSVEPVIADIYGDGRYGYYGFFNVVFLKRWNAGMIYDKYQRQGRNAMTDSSVKAFAGFSVMEETTVLRLSAERYHPHNERAEDTLMFQIVFAMGPHKTHIF